MKANQATLTANDSVEETKLHMAMELSKNTWKLAFGDGSQRRPRLVTVTARELGRLSEEVEKAKKRFGMSEKAAVVSCYEAGRDGFWIHRALVSMGIDNLIVDSASIEVSRRKRRAKTDRLDATKLLYQLVRHVAGEKKVWSVLRVPSIEDEDDRQLHRELEILKGERSAHRQRIQSLLFLHGIDLTANRKFSEALETVRQWDGRELPPGTKERIIREYERLIAVEAQQAALRKERKRLMEEVKTKKMEKVKLLLQLCGIGEKSAWIFGMEFFGWREFSNRREVGGAVGLTGTPYNSGDHEHDQGISKTGNPLIRWLAVEIAWCWLRYQPDSELSQWYQRKFGGGGKRMHRVGIVALARRLMVDLWRLTEFGIVPAGARLKVA